MMDVNALKRDIETDNSLLRMSDTRLRMEGQYYDGKDEIEIKFKKAGVRLRDTLEIGWNGHIQAKTAKGYKTHWVWNYANLEKKDVRRLIKWLIKQEKEMR